MKTNDNYISLRQGLIAKILGMDPDKRRFFPRVIRARLREIARLDADCTHRDFNSCYNALTQELNITEKC
jgi:hypothetical protein